MNDATRCARSRHGCSRLLFFSVLAYAVLALPATVRAESPMDILIIVNKKNLVDTVSVAEVRNFFLKRRGTWSYGAPVVPVNSPKGSKLRRDFRRAVLMMSSSEESRYWRDREIMSGVTAPPGFPTPLKAVFKLKNSISYVYRKDLLPGVVKVIAVIPNGKAAP